MKKVLCTLTILSLVVFFSCRGIDPDGNPVSLVGKWNFERNTYVEFRDGIKVYEQNYIGVGTEYYDFRPDNKLYVFVQGQYDTTAYQLQGNDKVQLSGNWYDIKTLTASNATLYFKIIHNPTTYGDYTIYLKR
jgi:hypothetical protein